MGTTRTTLKIAATAAAIVTTAGLALATPAAAETQTHRDPRGDVQAAPIFRAAPQPGIDITRVENRYRARKLTLSVTFADLQRDGYSLGWRIKTPDDDYLLVLDTVDPEPQVFFVNIGDLTRGTVGGNCRGVDVARTGDTLTGTVPRRCIDDADQVRISAQSAEPRLERPTRLDDSRREGLSDSGRVKYGPVLERN